MTDTVTTSRSHFQVNSREFLPRKDENRNTRKTITHWIYNVKNLPKNGDLLQNLAKRIVPDVSKNIGKESQNEWIKFKDSILQRNDALKVQFVKISRTDALEARSSYRE